MATQKNNNAPKSLDEIRQEVFGAAAKKIDFNASYYKQQEQVTDFVMDHVTLFLKSFGNCTKCWGKGYSLLKAKELGEDQKAGRNTMPGREGEHIIFCECERGFELHRDLAPLGIGKTL